MESLGAPVDERVARRRPRSRQAFLARGLPWLLALGVVLLLQHQPVYWEVASGRLRVGLQVLAMGVGFVMGWFLTEGDLTAWATWPPEGALFQRVRRRGTLALAAGWWQLLWMLPAGTVVAAMVAAMVIVALIHPGEVAGTLYAADLVWRAIVAAAVSAGLSQPLRTPDAKAITPRGIHTSPMTFVPWRQISHAIADPAAGVVRVYSRKRPWFPLTVMVFSSREEFHRVRELLAEYLVCLAPPQEARRYRVEWVLFMGAMVVIVGGVTAGALLLLLLPGALQALSAGLLMQWLILSLEQMPELALLIAFSCGRALDTWLMGMRGIKRKQVVSEAP